MATFLEQLEVVAEQEFKSAEDKILSALSLDANSISTNPITSKLLSSLVEVHSLYISAVAEVDKLKKELSDAVTGLTQQH